MNSITMTTNVMPLLFSVDLFFFVCLFVSFFLSLNSIDSTMMLTKISK